ncbi:MAG: hypothetical protein ACKPKO_62865, partial [Candidatus Fonsibacter sp.]
MYLIPLDGHTKVLEHGLQGDTIKNAVGRDCSVATSKRGDRTGKVRMCNCAEEVVCDGGRQGRWLLRCVKSLVVEHLDGYDEHELRELGLVLNDVSPICAASSPVDRVSSEQSRTFRTLLLRERCAFV